MNEQRFIYGLLIQTQSVGITIDCVSIFRSSSREAFAELENAMRNPLSARFCRASKSKILGRVTDT